MGVDSLQRLGHADREILWGYVMLFNTRNSASRRHPSLHCTPKCHHWGYHPHSSSRPTDHKVEPHSPCSWLAAQRLKTPLPLPAGAPGPWSCSEHFEVCLRAKLSSKCSSQAL